MNVACTAIKKTIFKGGNPVPRSEKSELLAFTSSKTFTDFPRLYAGFNASNNDPIFRRSFDDVLATLYIDKKSDTYTITLYNVLNADFIDTSTKVLKSSKTSEKNNLLIKLLSIILLTFFNFFHSDLK